MRRSRKILRFVLIAIVGASLAYLSRELVLAVAKPAANAPITLHFQEAPILLGPHEHSVAAIAFSHDGKTVATGAHDGFVRLWDSDTGRLKSIMGNDSTTGIRSMAFSPDG